MGQNPECIRGVLLPQPSPVLANIHSILAYNVPDTENVGLPTKHRLNVGPALQPIAGSMPINLLRRWPSTNLLPGLLYILWANTCHSTNTVSMLTHSLRRWPVIETALSDCIVFSDYRILLVTFKIPASETPDNTIHGPNADVMMGHRLRRWATIFQPKPFKLLTTNIIVNIIITEHLLKTKVLNLRTWNAIFDLFIRTGVQKCQPFHTHITPLPPLNRTRTTDARPTLW